MKKQIISFNLMGYESAKKTLFHIVDVINRYSSKLTDKGFVLTEQDIKSILEDKKSYRKYIYQKELMKVADEFGMDYDIIKTLSYRMLNPLFSDMASNRCKVMLDFIDDVWAYGCSYLSNYIDIMDNIATIKINSDKELKEYFTDYTRNEMENKVLCKLNLLRDIYKELAELGVSKYNVRYILNDSDLSVNANRLHSLLK